MGRGLARGASWAVLFLAAGCRSQVLPGPMIPLSDPLPRGEAGLFPPGPEEVVVVRHADPVRVRPAGLRASYPLSFYDKTTRLNSGSGVLSAPGGRIEIIWPGDGSIVLSGEGSGIVGSASRGEPTFIFREVERATLNLVEGDHVELLGGSILTASSGPFVLEHFTPEILRVRNQSKEAARIAFRSETLQLDPGEVVDLPLLSSGGGPLLDLAGLDPVEGPGFAAGLRGDCEVERRSDALVFRGRGSSEVRALGVEVHLEDGETATLSALSTDRSGSDRTTP